MTSRCKHDRRSAAWLQHPRRAARRAPDPPSSGAVFVSIRAVRGVRESTWSSPRLSYADSETRTTAVRCFYQVPWWLEWRTSRLPTMVSRLVSFFVVGVFVPCVMVWQPDISVASLSLWELLHICHTLPATRRAILTPSKVYDKGKVMGEKNI